MIKIPQRVLAASVQSILGTHSSPAGTASVTPEPEDPGVGMEGVFSGFEKFQRFTEARQLRLPYQEMSPPQSQAPQSPAAESSSPPSQDPAFYDALKKIIRIEDIPGFLKDNKPSGNMVRANKLLAAPSEFRLRGKIYEIRSQFWEIAEIKTLLDRVIQRNYDQPRNAFIGQIHVVLMDQVKNPLERYRFEIYEENDGKTKWKWNPLTPDWEKSPSLRP